MAYWPKMCWRSRSSLPSMACPAWRTLPASMQIQKIWPCSVREEHYIIWHMIIISFHDMIWFNINDIYILILQFNFMIKMEKKWKTKYKCQRLNWKLWYIYDDNSTNIIGGCIWKPHIEKNKNNAKNNIISFRPERLLFVCTDFFSAWAIVQTNRI